MKIKVNDEISQNIADIELGSISLANIIDLIRPIGSLYWSEKNTNSSTIYPGTTWVQVTDTWIVAAGSTYTAGKSYGAASHTHTSAAHTHTVNGHTHTSAAHTHTVNGHTHSTGNHTLTIDEIPNHAHWGIFGDNGAERRAGYGTGTAHTGTINEMTDVAWESLHTGSTGGGGTHNHGNTGSTSLTTNSTTPGATGSTSLTTNSTTPGNTGSSSNIPPSIAMYCWKRTA